MDINKIAKEMTRGEFLNNIKEKDKYECCGFTYKNRHYSCPSLVLGFEDVIENCKDYNEEKCFNCWQNAIKYIKFKGENDMEYTFMEVINNIKNNEKWICTSKIYILQSIEKVENHIIFNYDENMSNKSLTIDINANFKLLKKDKKVSFKEAIQAYGKEVYCIWRDNNGIEHKSEYCIRNEWDQCITDQNCEHLAPAEIVKGEWYIKED